MSALLKVIAFTQHLSGMAKAFSVLIGVMMPVAIYTLTKLAVPLYLNGDRRARPRLLGVPLRISRCN